MREEGHILLVSAYELGHPPLGIAWPAAFLRRAGYRPALADLATSALDNASVDRARLIVFSTPMFTALSLAVRTAKRVRRRNPEAYVVFAGDYAILNRELLLDGIAHEVMGGEVEEELLDLARAREHGAARTRTQTIHTRRLPLIAPAREGLPPLERYARLMWRGRELLTGAVQSTRGCKHLCRHCPIPAVYEGHFFAVDAEVVLADVDALVEAGAQHLTFADPDFLNAPTHARRIAAALHARHPQLTFDFTAKVEHLLKAAALLPELRRQGCIFIVSAVESLSDRVLNILDKGHTRADVEHVLEITADAGIALRPSLLPFTPWTTLGDYRELVSFIAERELVPNVDPVQLTVRLLVPPGSLLELHPEMKPHLLTLDRPRFGWTWRHPDPRMDQLQLELSELVETRTSEGKTPPEIYADLARVAQVDADFSRDRERHEQRALEVPRLTEPWFC